MGKTQKEMRVEVTYDAAVQKRAGQAVLVLTRTEYTTPVSGRGREWDKAVRRRTVQVLPYREAQQFISALTDAVFAAADPNIHPQDAEGIDLGDEPGVFLWRSNGTTWIGEPTGYWTHDEAVEAWRAMGCPQEQQWAASRQDPGKNAMATTALTDEYK